MKARYHLPPDAHARLRMLANLASARQTTSLRDTWTSEGRSDSSAGGNTTGAGRVGAPAQRGN